MAKRYNTKLDVPKIRHLLDMRGKTVKELAWMMGVSPNLVEKFLKDETAPVDYTDNVARALGVPIITITTA